MRIAMKNYMQNNSANPYTVTGKLGNLDTSTNNVLGMALTLAVWGFAGYGVYMFATKKKTTRRRR